MLVSMQSSNEQQTVSSVSSNDWPQKKEALTHFLLKAIETNNTPSKPISAVAVGTPYMDIIYQVSDSFIEQNGLKKGDWIGIADSTAFSHFLSAATLEDPCPVRQTGGSTSNTIKVLAALQNPVAFLGKLGNDDSTRFYRDVIQKLKIHLLTEPTEKPMGQVAIFITPDSQRTFVCFPSSSVDLSPEMVLSKNPFKNVKSAHFEGYMIKEFSLTFIQEAMKNAKQKGAMVSFDLGAPNLIENHRDQILDLLPFVDIVFANEEEAKALLGDSSEQAAKTLSSFPFCSTAVILQGEKGALVGSRSLKKPFSSSSIPATKVDSTGCGDAFIGGFLHGLLLNRSLEECAWIGNLLGGTVVEVQGAEIPSERWPALIKKITDYLQ